MVQLLKMFLMWIGGLFPQRALPTRSLSFDFEKLNHSLILSAIDLHRTKSDQAIEILTKIIETERNLQVLRIHKVTTETALIRHQGRLEALGYLLQYIADSLDPEQHTARMKDLESKSGTKSKTLIRRRAWGSDPVL